MRSTIENLRNALSAIKNEALKAFDNSGDNRFRDLAYLAMEVLENNDSLKELSEGEFTEKEENEFAKVLTSASTIHLYEVAAHEENLDNLEAETL